MIPPDIAATMREALILWITDYYTEEDEDQRINAALQWLDTLPAAPAPDWSSAPDWAMWWAVDPNGWAHWFQEEPIKAMTINYSGWIAKTINGIQQGAELWATEIDLPIDIDWRTTLHARPTEDK